MSTGFSIHKTLTATLRGNPTFAHLYFFTMKWSVPFRPNWPSTKPLKSLVTYTPVAAQDICVQYTCKLPLIVETALLLLLLQTTANKLFGKKYIQDKWTADCMRKNTQLRGKAHIATLTTVACSLFISL